MATVKLSVVMILAKHVHNYELEAYFFAWKVDVQVTGTTSTGHL